MTQTQTMEKRPLGRSGLEVTVLTMGCWQAGGQEWNDTDDEHSLKAIRAAYESGINFFDTAEAYGFGHSEEIVARALSDVYDDVLIATKLHVGNMAHDKVREACENSLRRLKLETVDLYQIHWPSGTWGSPVVPLGETMTELMKLKDEGKFRALGVSNFNSQQIEEALQYGRIDSLQPPYSLFWRVFEQNGTFETCRKHDIGIIAYSPIAQGLLTGKFSHENRPTDNRANNALFKDPTYDKALKAVAQLKPIAEKYETTTAHIAIQWLLQQPGITSAIVGARNPEQVRDNALAAWVQLSPEDVTEIERIGRTVTDDLPVDRTNPWS